MIAQIIKIFLLLLSITLHKQLAISTRYPKSTLIKPTPNLNPRLRTKHKMFQQNSPQQFLRIGACKYLKLYSSNMENGSLQCIYLNEHDSLSSREDRVCQYFLDQLQVQSLVPFNCHGDSNFGFSQSNPVMITNSDFITMLIQIQLNDLTKCPQQGFACLKSSEKILNARRKKMAKTLHNHNSDTKKYNSIQQKRMRYQKIKQQRLKQQKIKTNAATSSSLH